ncbi:small integral membrane protein 8, partial [Pundamilia nyererei]|uniref:Small integral membrane protein 8 n=2 Tax=Haplochromini TaxID=319058 RepID=A0A9Y3S825_9CICH
NKPVMAFGLLSITLCVGYLGYLHAMKENDQQLYEAIDSEGERTTRRKSSKWD